MPNFQLLTHKEGGTTENDNSIVDFIKNPFSPCFVYSGLDSEQSCAKPRKEIAWNFGNFLEAHRFKSFIGNLDGGPKEEIFMLDYLIDDKILIKGAKENLNFYKHHEKVFGQRGFCEILYFSSSSDIINEFLEQGYSIYEFPHNMLKIKEWNRLNQMWREQKRKNTERLEEKIQEFYYGKNYSNKDKYNFL